MGVVGVALSAAARYTAAGGVGWATGRRRGRGAVAAALLAGGLLVLARMLAVLMTAAGTAEAADVRIVGTLSP